MEPCKKLIRVVEGTLDGVSIYLRELDGERYRRELDLFSGSSTGQHTRHIIEFLQCLIEQSQSKEGIINYDKRKRNLRIEQEPEAAMTAIEQILEKLKSGELREKLVLQSLYDEEEGSIHEVATTLDRELVYNIEHAIHHMAIIKIGLKVLAPEIKLPEGFGVAPSTIKHRHNQMNSGATAEC